MPQAVAVACVRLRACVFVCMMYVCHLALQMELGFTARLLQQRALEAPFLCWYACSSKAFSPLGPQELSCESDWKTNGSLGTGGDSVLLMPCSHNTSCLLLYQWRRQQQGSLPIQLKRLRLCGCAGVDDPSMAVRSLIASEDLAPMSQDNDAPASARCGCSRVALWMIVSGLL